MKGCVAKAPLSRDIDYLASIPTAVAFMYGCAVQGSIYIYFVFFLVEFFLEPLWGGPGIRRPKTRHRKVEIGNNGGGFCTFLSPAARFCLLRAKTIFFCHFDGARQDRDPFQRLVRRPPSTKQGVLRNHEKGRNVWPKTAGQLLDSSSSRTTSLPAPSRAETLGTATHAVKQSKICR